MKQLIILLAVLFIPIAFVLASEEKEKDDKDDEAPEAVVTYEILLQGTYSGIREPVASVIQTVEDWEQLWKKHVSLLVPQPPLPEVDFNTSSIVAIAAGEKPTSGYSVTLRNIAYSGNDIEIKYRLTEPQPNSFTLQVTTQPVLILKVLKPQGVIKLTKE